MFPRSWKTHIWVYLILLFFGWEISDFSWYFMILAIYDTWQESIWKFTVKYQSVVQSVMKIKFFIFIEKKKGTSFYKVYKIAVLGHSFHIAPLGEHRSLPTVQDRRWCLGAARRHVCVGEVSGIRQERQGGFKHRSWTVGKLLGSPGRPQGAIWKTVTSLYTFKKDVPIWILV